MFDYLKPRFIDSPKKRLGTLADGGYVVPEILLEKCVALFTYGVGGDVAYEVDFEKQYKKPVYMFDHTTNQQNWDEGNLHFINEGLGKNEKCKDFLEHYDQFTIQGDVLLKIDTEGAEFDYFENVNIDLLASRTAGIILEVHWLEQEQNRLKFISIMEKIRRHFVMVHIHGNNWGGEFEYEGFIIPRVPELTFINKRYLTGVAPYDKQKYPISGVDYPNNPNISDCNLDFIQST